MNWRITLGKTIISHVNGEKMCLRGIETEKSMVASKAAHYEKG